MQGEGGNLTPTQKGFRVDLSAAVFLSPVLRKYLDPTNRSQASSWEMQVTGQQGGSGIYAACEPDSKFGVVLSITHSAGEAATRSRGAKGLRLHAEAAEALIPVVDRFMTAAELGVLSPMERPQSHSESVSKTDLDGHEPKSAENAQRSAQENTRNETNVAAAEAVTDNARPPPAPTGAHVSTEARATYSPNTGTREPTVGQPTRPEDDPCLPRREFATAA